MTSLILPTLQSQSYTTCPVYFNMQFHHGLPDTKGILQRYMPLLHQSVTMKTAVSDLPLLVLAYLIICVAVYVGLSSVKPLVLLMSHLDHQKVVANHVVNYVYRWFALITSVVPLTIRPLNVITKILAATLNGLFMLFLVPSVIYNTWARVIT